MKLKSFPIQFLSAFLYINFANQEICFVPLPEQKCLHDCGKRWRRAKLYLVRELVSFLLPLNEGPYNLL